MTAPAFARQNYRHENRIVRTEIPRIVSRNDLPAAQNLLHTGVGRIALNVIQQVGGVGRQFAFVWRLRFKLLRVIARVCASCGGQKRVADGVLAPPRALVSEIPVTAH